MTLQSPQREEPGPVAPIIERYLDIKEFALGSERLGYEMRFAGKLRMDSESAYAALNRDLRPHKLTPIFTEEKGQHVIHLVQGRPKARRSNPLINLILFGLTLMTMLMAGGMYVYEGPPIIDEWDYIIKGFNNMGEGFPFALSLLAILLAHEFGHYIAARLHKTEVTLPYFLPFPLSPFGSFGAFIQLKEPPRNKRVLLDIGLAGPLAGLIVAVPILLIGLSLSEFREIPAFFRAGEGYSLEGNSVLYLLSKFLVLGQWLPSPDSLGGLDPLVYWVRFYLTGTPFPLGGTDVVLDSVAWAGWAGLLVTSMNLIPAGQLDGGHILYALFGKNARFVLPFILLGIGLLGFFWSGWWLWVFLILMMGGVHAQPLDQITKLDAPRIALAILGLIIFILVFIPVPLIDIVGPFGG
jgi:membrane-associated protease RseP (regulator of RpoE activity)